MDKTRLKAAMKAVTASIGRKAGASGGGAGTEKLRARLTDALTAGERKTTAGKVVPYSAAQTVRMAARLLVAGGTVPDTARARFTFSLAIPALREMAEVMGCDADALVASLVAPVETDPEVVAAGLRVVEQADAMEDAATANIVQPARRSATRRG